MVNKATPARSIGEAMAWAGGPLAGGGAMWFGLPADRLQPRLTPACRIAAFETWCFPCAAIWW